MEYNTDINYVLNTLDCKPSMLAALLGISPDTLIKWHTSTDKIHDPRKIRLYRLRDVIKAMDVCKIQRELMLNVLNEPLFGEDSESWLDLILR